MHRLVLSRALAAFGYRDFRVLWFGAFTSTVGNWMQEVAQAWLVFDLTNSSFFLGLDDFLGQLPILLFTLIGGVVRRSPRSARTSCSARRYIQMSTAFILAALVFAGAVRVEYVLLLSFVAGLGQAFGGPAYQSLIPSLVEKKDLPNAIALNSIQFNLARVFGPLLAGVTLAAWGGAACFGLNGLSFLVVIVALMSLTIKHIPPVEKKPMLQELKGGLSYAKGQPAIVALTILASLTTFLGLPLLTLLPIFARDIFHGDINRYSHMMAFSGAGAVCGALIVAWLGRFHRMGLAVLIVQAIFGALVTAFAMSRIGWLSDLLLFCDGRGAADGLLDDRVADSAHRPRQPARTGDEHLHGGVPRRHAARQPGGRLGGELHISAACPGGQRRTDPLCRRLLPDQEPRRPRVVRSVSDRFVRGRRLSTERTD